MSKLGLYANSTIVQYAHRAMRSIEGYTTIYGWSTDIHSNCVQHNHVAYVIDSTEIYIIPTLLRPFRHSFVYAPLMHQSLAPITICFCTRIGIVLISVSMGNFA